MVSVSYICRRLHGGFGRGPSSKMSQREMGEC